MLAKATQKISFKEHSKIYWFNTPTCNADGVLPGDSPNMQRACSKSANTQVPSNLIKTFRLLISLWTTIVLSFPPTIYQ